MPDERNIDIRRDANDNVIITGDGNLVIVQATRSLEVAAAAPAARPEIGPNPYRGLEVFREEHADRYFGREALTEKLWTIFRDLHQPPVSGPTPLRLLPIVGPSGSGKSSLARAGLIAELARRPLPGRSDARVGVITPGSHPIESLALVLARIATGDQTPVAKTAELAQRLRQATPSGTFDGLRFIVDLLPEIATKPIIILVDQFEEAYSLCDDAAERDAFIATLLHAAAAPGARVSIILTLRSDFLGATNRHAELSRALAERAVLVPVMGEAELRRAIEQPAINAGHPIDSATVELLVAETAGREGALPLLQFVLTRIWEGVANGIAPAQTVKDLGGVGGALAKEAERLYRELPEPDRRIVRRAFLAQVRLGEGTTWDSRRRAALEEIVAEGEDKEHVLAVLRAFSRPDERLITLRGDPSLGTVTAELTHEALLEHWEDLKGWIRDSRDDLRFQRRLSEAVEDWEAQGKPSGLLWRSPNLDLLRSFQRRRGVDMTPSQIAFFQASEEQQRRERRQRFAARAAILGTIALVALWALWRNYFHWVEARPWGRLVSLSTGESYLLSQDSALVGRPSEDMKGIRHQVALHCRPISRLHLSIFSTGQIVDWRSFYGTTLNGNVLPYGVNGELADGDILVLSGRAPLVYRSIKWRPWHYVHAPELPAEKPAEGWAVLVDGKRRVWHAILGDEAFVTLRGAAIGLSDNPADDAVLAVRQRRFHRDPVLDAQAENLGPLTQLELNDGTYAKKFHYDAIHASKNNWDPGGKTSALSVQPLSAATNRIESWIKEGDYGYRHIVLSAEAETVGIIGDERHRVGEILYNTEAGTFQVVPTATDFGGKSCELADGPDGIELVE